jgi:hypothetical protein
MGYTVWDDQLLHIGFLCFLILNTLSETCSLYMIPSMKKHLVCMYVSLHVPRLESASRHDGCCASLPRNAQIHATPSPPGLGI